MRTRYLLAVICFSLFFLVVGLGTNQVGLFGLYDKQEQVPPDGNTLGSNTLGNFGQLPQLRLTSFQDEEISNADLIDKVVIINFWASWCAPCIKEFPLLLDSVLNRPQEQQVILLAISNDQHYDDMLAFLKGFPRATANPDKVKIVWDPQGKIGRDKFNVIYLPETFFVKDNIILSKIVGEINKDANDDDLSIIDELVNN